MECSIWLSSEYMIAGIFIQMSSNHSVFFSYISIKIDTITSSTSFKVNVYYTDGSMTIIGCVK